MTTIALIAIVFAIAGDTNLAQQRIVESHDQRSPSALTYRLELDAPHPAENFASEVDAILSDPRSWPYRFQPADDTDQPDLRIILAGPELRHNVCTVLGDLGPTSSCALGNTVYVSAERWQHGGSILFPDLDDHRAFIINHEIGHALGHTHATCPEPGAMAPIMMPHAHSEGWAGMHGCTPNAWPRQHHPGRWTTCPR